jgi:crotonobetainyl-CoA:carnitine CoA-transferase CaiB-like acyl-CoA transferase
LCSFDHFSAHPSIYVACDYVAGWLATCGILSSLLRRAKEAGSCRVVVSLSRTALRLPEFGIFDRDYATKTAGSNDEHLYPDPDAFITPPLRIRPGNSASSEAPGRTTSLMRL